MFKIRGPLVIGGLFMTRSLLVFTTCPNQDSALTLSKSLVSDKLAACVSVLPAATSIYMWKGQQEAAEEFVLLIKTRESCYQELEASIINNHPYELPEIIATPIVAGSEAYLNWIAANTKP